MRNQHKGQNWTDQEGEEDLTKTGTVIPSKRKNKIMG